MASTRTERARTLASKIPTKWILTGAVALLLAASALFGGLNDAPAAPIPVLELGDSSEGTRISLEVERVAVIDAFPDLNLVPEDGNRYLVVVGIAENVWTTPVSIIRSTFGTPQPATVVSPRVDGIEATTPDEVLVFSDATIAGDLQPGVPVELAFLWQVPADMLIEGDSVTLDFWDEAYLREGTIGFGSVFDDPALSATQEFAVTDAGDGTG